MLNGMRQTVKIILPYAVSMCLSFIGWDSQPLLHEFLTDVPELRCLSTTPNPRRHNEKQHGGS
jgi:hypothetical protein